MEKDVNNSYLKGNFNLVNQIACCLIYLWKVSENMELILEMGNVRIYKYARYCTVLELSYKIRSMHYYRILFYPKNYA